MSADLMREVFQLDLPSTEKHVATILAWFGNDDGGDIFPSVETVKGMTGLSKRTVQRTLRCLERKGLLVPVKGNKGGRNRTTEYQMRTYALPQTTETVTGCHPFGVGKSTESTENPVTAPAFDTTPKDETVTFAPERMTTCPERVSACRERVSQCHPISSEQKLEQEKEQERDNNHSSSYKLSNLTSSKSMTNHANVATTVSERSTALIGRTPKPKPEPEPTAEELHQKLEATRKRFPMLAARMQ